MKEHPILFSSPMVKALLAGTKTQTRRLLKPAPPTTEAVLARAGITFSIFTDAHSPGTFRVGGPVWAVRELMGVEPDWRSPYGEPGDRLWVRETLLLGDDGSWVYAADSCPIELVAGDPNYPAMLSWAHHNERERCNSIHMPRWASRITLEVTSVRVERLQDISEEDAKAEGVDSVPVGDIPRNGTLYHRDDFAQLWDIINGSKAPWSSNPWVWVVGFRRLP